MSYTSGFLCRLLEEAVDRSAWLICTGINQTSECTNLLDFMIRRLKMFKTVNDNFRFWIVCQDIKDINLVTAQRTVGHYLGIELPVS